MQYFTILLNSMLFLPFGDVITLINGSILLALRLRDLVNNEKTIAIKLRG